VTFLLVGTIITRLFTDLAIPGWATYTGGLLLILLVQAGIASLFLAFVILNNRAGAAFLPLRDYGFFVKETILVVPKPSP
jgi:hypothetical protein